MESSNGAKKLTVTFNETTKRPEYVFEGRWIGADASLAGRKLWKAYKEYLLEKRKETKVNEAIETAKEIKDATRTSPARAGRNKGRFTSKTK